MSIRYFAYTYLAICVSSLTAMEYISDQDTITTPGDYYQKQLTVIDEELTNLKQTIKNANPSVEKEIEFIAVDKETIEIAFNMLNKNVITRNQYKKIDTFIKNYFEYFKDRYEKIAELYVDPMPLKKNKKRNIPFTMQLRSSKHTKHN